MADDIVDVTISVLRRNPHCVSKPAILLGRANLGVPEKSRSSTISKGLRLASGGAPLAGIT